MLEVGEVLEVVEEGAEVKDAKTVRMLEVGEVLEVVEEDTKADSLGLARGHVKAEKDEQVGWVSLASNVGKVFLEPFSAFTACASRVEAALTETEQEFRKAQTYLDQKVNELKSAGPPAKGQIAEAKV